MRSITNVAEAFFAACETGKRRRRAAPIARPTPPFAPSLRCCSRASERPTACVCQPFSISPSTHARRRCEEIVGKPKNSHARAQGRKGRKANRRVLAAGPFAGLRASFCALASLREAVDSFRTFRGGRPRLWIQDPGDTLCPSASVLSRLTLDNRPRSLGGEGGERSEPGEGVGQRPSLSRIMRDTTLGCWHRCFTRLSLLRAMCFWESALSRSYPFPERR